MLSHVFVIDTNKQPLPPVYPGDARRVLTRGKAAVYRRFPFTIVLKTACAHPPLDPLRLACTASNQAKGTQDIGGSTGGAAASFRGCCRQRDAPGCVWTSPGVGVAGEAWLWRSDDLQSHDAEPAQGALDRRSLRHSTPASIVARDVIPLTLAATGHECRQECCMNAQGFACSWPRGAKKVRGFQTGDTMRAVVPTGTRQGIYVRCVLVRACMRVV
jgi:hypothetical protein